MPLGIGSLFARPGEPFPPFLLPDQDGRLVSFEELLGRGPVVAAFVRGHWCPYCQLNVTALPESVGPGLLADPGVRPVGTAGIVRSL